jgi:hypothetical protein
MASPSHCALCRKDFDSFDAFENHYCATALGGEGFRLVLALVNRERACKRAQALREAVLLHRISSAPRQHVAA